MTRRLAALACALLLVTAGCAGIGGSDDRTTTAPTQTTAETTEATETTTEAAERLAPGVTADGVEDARALADAHRDALAGHAFVRQSSRQRTNESRTAYRNQTLRHQNASSWLLTTTRSGMDGVALGVRNGTYELYADGERALWRLEDGDTENTTYGVRSITADGDQVVIPPDQVFENNLTPLYERSLVYTLAANAESVEPIDGGNGGAELSGSADELAVDRQQVTDAEFTVTIAGDGHVRSIELAYEGGNATVERTITFDTDVVDPVEEPDWYGTALNETGLSEAPTSGTDE